MPIRLTPVVRYMLIVCAAIFVVEWALEMAGVTLQPWLALTPTLVIGSGRIWQLFTYSFFDHEPMRLLLNLMMLAFIGSDLEGAWGAKRFLKYYFFCSTAAGLLYIVMQAIAWSPEGRLGAMVGGSAAVYGLLMAYGLIFGERVMLFMMLFPMKAKHFIWVLAAIQFFTSTAGGRFHLDTAAHLGGMAAGFAYLWVWASLSMMKKKKAAAGPAKKAKKRANAPHLTLIKNTGSDAESDDADENPKTWH